MPINTGNNDTSQLLEEISKLKLSGGSDASFKYAKSAINCQIPANTETKILDSNSDCSREILLINNTSDAEIQLFWDDGINKVELPDKLKNRYFDYSDGGLALLVKSNININIDIYVRSTKPILEKVGNAVIIPEIEEIWYTWEYGYDIAIHPFKIPLKPIYIYISGFEDETNPFPIFALPLTPQDTYDYENQEIIGNILNLPILWEDFNFKKYIFYMLYYGEERKLNLSDEISISQDAEKWMITID